MKRWLWCLALCACDDGDPATAVADSAAEPGDMRPIDAAPLDMAAVVDQQILDAAPVDQQIADQAVIDQAVPPDQAVVDATVDAAPDMAPIEGCVATVAVAEFEIFRYEASRPDATAEGPGADSASVCSRPGVLPWTDITLADAEIACATIGFAVCTGAQWQQACVGPNLWPYPYGEAYGQGVCNDHVTGSGALEVTGGRAACVGPTGIHDQNGNVWELTADGRRRGASYRLNASMFRPEAGACESSYVVPEAFFARDLGFRCCRALPPPG